MKLKRLILSGFKSFADRTEFDFDDGISCVVGPNGCGKSNVVDAVKWVLGEQSAKSLRGSEMMDVIFNGSSARRASPSAEVTLVFDNAGSLLSPPVQGQAAGGRSVSVTRRLFRSGESEYLINKQTCRLRDIREMFMDTGVGVDAYSVIEQGQVDRFLQASQEDRRAVFDEAAGISKYKARKKEAMRKLERVEQNLLRLHDILGEVDKRLRSIKVQAGRARNYQAYSERLKELKGLHFLAQYHDLSLHRMRLQQQADAGSDALAALHARIEQMESTCAGTEVELGELDRTAGDLQARIGAVAGQVEACRQRSQMLAAQVKQLGELIVSATHRCDQMQAKAESLQAQCAQRDAELEEVQTRRGLLAQAHEAVRDEHSSGEVALTHLQAKIEDEKAGTVDLLRRTAQLHTEIKGHGVRRESLDHQRSRLAARAEQITQGLGDLLTERAEFEAKLADVREVLAEAEARLARTRQAEQDLANGEQALHRAMSAAREERSGVQSRTGALREMQDRLEGVAVGVRRVLQERREGRLQAVRGMLGDFVQTDVEHAPAVEAALAGADQQLLIASFDDLCAVRERINAVLGDGGAVEVLCLDRLETLCCDFDAAACPGVQARVIDWVRFEPWLAPAMWRLLGRTLVVETLADAAAAARRTGPGLRFVTRSGEVLEADGRVRFGSGNRGAGVIARHSELARLEARRQELDHRIAELDEQLRSARQEIQHLAQVEQSIRTAIYEANTERVECSSRLGRLSDQVQALQREQPIVAQDLQALADEIESAVQAEHEARQKTDELERVRAEREQEVRKLTEHVAGARERQAELSQRWTELKVAMAAADEKASALREALVAAQKQAEQIAQDLAAGEAEIHANRERRAEAEAGAERATQDAQRLAEQHQALQQEAREVEESRRGLQEKLEAVRAQLAQERKRREGSAEQLNALRVELGEADVRVESLIARAADEMNADLPAQFAHYQHDAQRDWDAVAAEIQDLRAKMERLGNVNLDAIAEQEELENRHSLFAEQIRDVEESRNRLHELIRRINKESRELFLTTFEAVRVNFQALFRKLFGGGRADILLLDPENVLESPIEIVARPPGKELRSLTLLSGGEKTMTALALVFSIFQCRPSPFCLLDEVDAALDEANTERFTRLLQEFIQASQFIIISHAKRTMSMANVLYGVTMQEPGVSTRISVRFEDVGHHLDSELQPVGS